MNHCLLPPDACICDKGIAGECLGDRFGVLKLERHADSPSSRGVPSAYVGGGSRILKGGAGFKSSSLSGHTHFTAQHASWVPQTCHVPARFLSPGHAIVLLTQMDELHVSLFILHHWDVAPLVLCVA